VDTLCRKTKNNALLIGLPGVGKTTIVEGLCNLLTSDTCPKCLQGYSIFSLSIPKLIAGSKYRGDLEERVTQLFEELLHVPKLIIFMDEIHQLVGTGSYEVPTSSLSDILKPYLTGEHIRIIGATTTDEFRKLEFDKALERRFSVIQIPEPTKQKTLTILENVKDTYSEFHEVDIPSNMLD
jgi:ATP-dependent Clp protease ATP-binding subunit ClpA